MSQELERVYTINLGKVLLSPNNQRAKRAINMIKEYARHHMKTEEIASRSVSRWAEASERTSSRGSLPPPRSRARCRRATECARATAERAGHRGRR